MNKWEYKTQSLLSFELPEALNGLGADGWELVGIHQYPNSWAIYIFKRPVQEEP